MHPAHLGQLALDLTLAFTLAAFATSAAASVRARPAWARAGRWLVVGAFAGASLACAVLLQALVNGDFSVRYVAERTSSSTPLVYRIGAWWGGQEGSLLFWLWLLLGYGALVATAPPDPRAAGLWPGATAVLMGIASFFAAVGALVESPFVRLADPPADGAGLNPLLQSPSMLAHPVALYLGYVGVAVPFAFMAAALLRGEGSERWAAVTRRWALAAWLFLGIGIVLGGQWAYQELGWGGYWGWDPVENASLIPWLLLTAYGHTALVQERRGGLSRWNAVLLASAFVSVLVGTFVTRSGILASVHAFAQSPSGPYFLAFVGLAAAFSLWLVAGRWELLREPDLGRSARAVSREGLIGAGNVVLVALVFTVAFGTAMPIVSQLVGPALSVQAPYFERVTAPLFALMLLLMGLAMAAPWRPASGAWLARHWPELAASLLFGALVWLGGVRRPLLAAGLACGFWAGAVPLGEVLRRLQGRRPQGGTAAFWRALAGPLAHLGVAVAAVAVVASAAFRQEATRSLAAGEQASTAGYVLRFQGLDVRPVPDATEVYAELAVFQDNRPVGRLQPARRLYTSPTAGGATTSEVAVLRRPAGDLYVALTGWDEGRERAAFEIYFNPLVNWLWGGAALALAGTGLSLLRDPAAALRRRTARQRVLQEALGLQRPQAVPSPQAAFNGVRAPAGAAPPR